MNSALAKEKIGDEAVATRTGKTWPEWYKALDAAGAAKLDHRGIVALAGRINLKMSGWWRQMVTASYEQARGLRQKHQRPDGYQVSASKTVAASQSALYRAWTDAQLRRKWLPDPFTVRKATTNKSLRITWADGSTSVDVMFNPKGTGKAQVTVQHSKLSSASAGKRMQSYWKQQLAKLSGLLEG